MDDVLCRQAITLRQLGIARLTTRQLATFSNQLGTRRAMNCAIHPSTTQQGGVRRVYDCRDIQFCDVTLKRFKNRSHMSTHTVRSM